MLVDTIELVKDVMEVVKNVEFAVDELLPEADEYASVVVDAELVVIENELGLPLEFADDEMLFDVAVVVTFEEANNNELILIPEAALVDEVEVEVEVEVRVELDDDAEYTLRRLGPPQYSSELPAQVIEQSEAPVALLPAAKMLSQKHWLEYSTPNSR